tara:strand:+ start:35 stop:376 length:342 start_codon:yes stop_codon:yes gene_type:complete
MAKRYNNFRILNNSNEYYRFLRKRRDGLKNIQHYETPILYHPSVIDRANLETTVYIWSSGDHYYKLAHQFYGDSAYWWIIAWYNGKPTEVDVMPGDAITIPLDIERILEVLGV